MLHFQINFKSGKPVYLQLVKDMSPTESGLAMLPMIAGLFTTSIGGGRRMSRTGRYRWFPTYGGLLVLAAVGPSALNIVLALTLGSAPGIARIVRSLVLELRTREFVAAARLRGESRWYIMLVEILHTIRITIREHTLVMEPFLIVGLIASVRRILILTPEAAEFLKSDPSAFRNSMIELVLLTLLILVLVVCIAILRRSVSRP